MKGPNYIFKSIHNGDIALKHVGKEQIEFKSAIGEMKKGNPRHKSPKQIQAISNIQNLYKSRLEALKLFNDFDRNMSENIYKSKHGTGLKILTPKHIPQRFPIALAQIKGGNNSESLLNEIREIAYSFYQSKEITKKVYNNIIKSIKV